MVSHRPFEASKKSSSSPPSSVNMFCLSSKSKFVQRKFVGVFNHSKMWIEQTGLAGAKSVCMRISGGCCSGRRRKKPRKKVKKVKEKFMEFCRKMVFPVRRVWFAVSSRFKARKNGAGLLKLHNDIQSCGYEDVQVMWEMLRRSESELMTNNSKRKHLSLWRIFVWSNHSAASSLSASHSG